ncbi:alpha/beta hydrolase [Sphingomonas sp. Leaf17]|nr:alpha/beta hydrolase [Sphingomonas sp. Leaf17]
MDHISVTAIGRGSPVILIPGLASPRAVWDGVADDLARTHRVYRVQVNGFDGDDPRGNLKPGILDGVVADLHTLVARDKLTGAAVVGHSMGGLVGLMLADRHPADVGRLMIVDALPFIGTLFDPAATVATGEPRAAMMRTMMRAAKPGAAMAGPPMSITPAGQAQVAAWSARADPRVVAQALYEDLTTDLRPKLTGIRTPITMLYPWSASAVPQATAAALYGTAYASAPNATLLPVADSYHFIMLDQPARFAAALEDFLKR